MQFKEYLGRAEELKALLSGQQPVTATPAGAAAQKARGPGKPTGGGGEGGGGDVCFQHGVSFILHVSALVFLTGMLPLLIKRASEFSEFIRSV